MRAFLRKLNQLVLLVLALFLLAASAMASGAGPNGINIGFDFNWNNGPGGYAASFIAASGGSGATLDNCAAPPITSLTSSCDFAFSYSIAGVPQTPVVSGGAYEHYPNYPSQPAFCDTNPSNSAPLTLFNCFNNDSFGQVFIPTATGALTAFAMPMTCLNPSGSPPTGLFAVIYQANPGGSSIPATPLGATPLNLSTCPTLTTWSNHQFSAADFAPIPMNFTNVTLTAGNIYAVYFSGLTPGSPLPGSPTLTSVSPASGPLTAGNTVTITGTGFTGAVSVTFGGVAARSFTVVSATQITAVVPSSTTVGAVSVVVTTPIGSNVANTLYSFVNVAPVATPTLSEWSAIVLVLLLLFIGSWNLRGRLVS